jgi:hypothetical protein
VWGGEGPLKKFVVKDLSGTTMNLLVRDLVEITNPLIMVKVKWLTWIINSNMVKGDTGILLLLDRFSFFALLLP